ncbi:MAG: hypothetical protein HY824_06005 [Acidobacteria bacterium]|nr:hypothetical protein [Acidobacteriota bacterium]
MRRIAITCALALLVTRPALAQEWTEYRSVRDGFQALFLGEPRVTETTWTSQTGFTLPARVYAVERGGERYSVTVADYTGIEELGKERARKCPAGAETCLGAAGLSGVGYWKHDTRGAPLYAASLFIKRDVKLTEMFWNQLYLVSGITLQLTSNVDASRTYAWVAMHEMKLYVAEATVPKGAPEPLLFVTGLGLLDTNGNETRYPTLYSHEIHGLREAPVPAR